jgi:hypothetical protein
MTNPDKIIPQVGEQPRQRAFQLPHLRPFLWDARIATGLHRACRDGSITILARTWRWVRAAAPGDRWIRALAPAGMLAGAVYALRTEPRAAAAGIVVAWLAAAAILAPQEAWAPPPQNLEEAPLAPPAEEAASPLDTPEGRRFAFLRWLEQTTRGTSGIHLDEMHRQLTKQETIAGLPRHHLRPLLQHYQIPVQRTLRVGAVAGRTGVSRQAIEDAFAEAAAAAPPAVATTPVEPSVDLPRPA